MALAVGLATPETLTPATTARTPCRAEDVCPRAVETGPRGSADASSSISLLSSMPTVRLATPADVPNLLAIEAAAGEAFRTIGMPEVADDPLPDPRQISAHVDNGRVWVAEVDGEVVAYALAVLRDERAHLEQVSVHPDHAGHRVGARLIDAVRGWARDRGDEQLTLTTFAEVPWNAPYYQRLGFCPLPDDALGPQLGAELVEERRRFAAARLAMTRPTQEPLHRA